MIGRADKNGPQGSGVNEDVSFTLDAADRHAVAYCMTTGTYTQMLKEQSPTLMARDYKDPPVVNETEPEYIVRRLTPHRMCQTAGVPGLVVRRAWDRQADRGGDRVLDRGV